MRKRDICGPPPDSFGELITLADICQAYVEYRKCSCDDKEWYEQQPTLADAIRKAAMARRASDKVAPKASGRRCSHHTRKPAVLLAEATRRLLERESAIAAMCDFDA